jgi:hypothetical protein
MFVAHFPAWPRLAGHVQQQGHRHLQHVKQPARQRDAGHAGPALPHLHVQLAHLEPRAVQQQDHLRLRVILRIPVRERADRPAVRHAEAAGAVGDRQPAQQLDQRAEHRDANPSAKRLAIAPVFEKA